MARPKEKPVSAPKYDPNKSFGFVMQDVARLMRREMNRRIKSLGLTYPQCAVMGRILAEPGMSQAKLADILEMQPISIGRLIDRMEAAGWVERRPDPADRRAVRLYHTARAEPILGKVWVLAAQMRADAAKGMSEKEKELLLDILNRMRANLSAPE
jgi:MarR family transcriptional regulator, transcriptional regulator for hemolysin